MASLRARLTAALIALAAVGLLVLGGVTYAEQRSFLFDRVDQQARAAVGAVAHAIREQSGGGADDGSGYGFGRPLPPPDDGGGGRGRSAELGGPPAGTYGQLRSASGAVLAETVLGSGTARPRLPATLVPGRLITVSGRSGGDPRYRVLAVGDRGPFAPAGRIVVVAVPMREVDQTLHRLLLVEGLVIAGVLLLLGVLARGVVRVGLLPLDRMGHTAGAIAGGDLSHRVEHTDPRTEVGRLGLALNAMLDRLEEAFEQREASAERLRTFLADASHELRTPLASIRGYAELLRMGAAADPEDAARATRRIEEEAARMGVLVEDLLTLARLDSVREAAHDEVDLGAVAADAASDAHAAAPDRDIGVTTDGELTVLGERDRLHQVVANLLANALAHTPAGTPVEVDVRGDGATVRLAVRDHGPGLPAGGDGAALFERFWRAEGGRTRGRAGAGLGLAIVAGIVGAHGGSVRAGDAPGGGAIFTVELPAAVSQPSLSTL